MSLTTFQSVAPNSYQGLEDFIPPELAGAMQPLVLELVRRLAQNQSKLLNDLSNQVVVDTALIPTIQSGQGDTVTYSAASSDDVEDSEICATMWGEN